MPRVATDAKITTREARGRLKPRNQPYWKAIDVGAAVGYRKGSTGGMWVARVQDASAGGGYRQTALGRADDKQEAAGYRQSDDGQHGEGDPVLDFRQAEARARAWVARHHRVAAGLEPEPAAGPTKPYTVADAIADYLKDYAARGGKALSTTQAAVDAHILPALGTVAVGRLTRDKLKTWHRALAETAARVRSKKGEERYRDSKSDPDATRRRRSSANRVLTILKAALNHARAEGKVTCGDDAWASVKAFREADKAKVRYLLDDEATRLINACHADFRELVSGALLTGCRYGELCAMRTSDFDPQAATLTVGRSKSGHSRHVALTEEGRDFFARLAAGKAGDARLFERDGTVKQATRDAPAQTRRVAWGKSDQFRLMREGCQAARIAPAVSFHDLRHTYASRLAMRGAPMGVIAVQLGHTDTRMTERHYAHLAPSFVAETVRATLGRIGIAPTGENVVTISARAKP